MNLYTEVQRAILSIVLNHGDVAFDVANRYLEERHFTELRYKMMWRCIKWLWDNEESYWGDGERRWEDEYDY